VRQFEERPRNDNLVRVPSEEGMGPTREFPPRWKVVRELSVDKLEGIDPVRQFELRARTDN
jgi:hypothetical protein